MAMFYFALFIHSFFYSLVDLENLFWMAGVSGTPVFLTDKNPCYHDVYSTLAAQSLVYNAR